MKIYNTQRGIIIEYRQGFYLIEGQDWNTYINRAGLHQAALKDIQNKQADPLLKSAIDNDLLPPTVSQEVWASGVTYLKSREARMEESKDAGGGDFYARVYDAERPELFFKAPAYRTVGTRSDVRIRKDSKWNVPEPELVLFMCSAGSIEGYTVGNDMSSRDIEGENPLYLPQAKSYDGSTAIGPCLYVPETSIDPDTPIQLIIERNGHEVFQGTISINRMKRKHVELASYLFRELSFPYGVFLMTGTGIVPPDSFTLQAKDVIKITIEPIGTLENTVA
jgi:2-dehydro-3-deoxy-D-arabinonate dehydratase